VKLPIGTYTLYNNFENCPFKAYNIYVLKNVPRVETPEMKWGNDVHSGLEHRIKDGTPLPETMQAAEPIAATLHRLKDRHPVYVEQKLGLTVDGKPTDFWSDNCWFRGKIDVVVHSVELAAAWVLDWKTGNQREEPFELETGALLVKSHHPDIENIVGEYFWLKTGQNGIRYTLNQADKTFGKLQALRSEMETYAMLEAWPKHKNPLCGWCPVMSCEHNTSHRRKQ
jgi:hypothetical protein